MSTTQCHPTLILSVLWTLSFKHVQHMASGARNKRVLNGIETLSRDRDEYYPHFRYTVFLVKAAAGEITENPSWWKFWVRNDLTPPKEYQHCGGALITPIAVQTACHCLATFSRNLGNYTYATPHLVFEDRIYSFLGANVISEMYYKLIPQVYVVHEACRLSTSTGPILYYDFGIILSKDSTYKSAKKAAISYAPVYKRLELREFYYTAIEKELTCMFLGFGSYAIGPPVDGKLNVVPDCSDNLRWGWRSIRSNRDCKALLYWIQITIFNYNRLCTWACFTSTSDNGYHHSSLPGDSGSPVICSNVYIAVQSFIIHNYDQFSIDSTASPTAFTEFENTYEYRDDFHSFCDEYRSGKTPTHPPDRFRPTPFPRLSPRTQCAPELCLHHSILLTTTLATLFM